METQCDQREHAAAYVLGELKGFALTDFMRHLLTCPECKEEVELLETAAHAVPLLATRQAPREQPPVRADSNAAFLTEPEPRARPTLESLTASDTSGQGWADSHKRRGSGRRGRRRNKIPTPVMIGVAALAVVAVLTAVLTRESNSIHYVHGKVGWSGGGAIVKIQGTRAELLVVNMPKPPAGHRYEIWALAKGAPQVEPTGKFLHITKYDEGGEGLPLDINDVLALAVYVEPIHGPYTTKSGAVIVADLRSVTDTTG